MSRAILQSALPLIVFSTILLREVISYLLFAYPGVDLLWYISFALGHELLTLQFLLDNVISDFAGKMFLLVSLIAITMYGWFGKNLFVKFISCHAALAVVCVQAFIKIGNKFALIVSLEPQLVNISYIGSNNLFYLFLAIALFCGCVQTHFQYFQRLSRAP